MGQQPLAHDGTAERFTMSGESTMGTSDNPEDFPVGYCTNPIYAERAGSPAQDHPAGEWISTYPGTDLQTMFWCPGDHVAFADRKGRAV